MQTHYVMFQNGLQLCNYHPQACLDQRKPCVGAARSRVEADLAELAEHTDSADLFGKMGLSEPVETELPELVGRIDLAALFGKAKAEADSAGLVDQIDSAVLFDKTVVTDTWAAQMA
jgi:hypothetical protein